MPCTHGCSTQHLKLVLGYFCHSYCLESGVCKTSREIIRCCLPPQLTSNWLFHFMLSNKYLDKSIQKAFMPTTPGCCEHYTKLATILGDAKRKHLSVWVDVANAYGSVYHSVILHALKHYHTLPKLVEALYTGLAARITSACWSTPLVPIQVGVYQGDPLSAVIFKTVINTLVDTLQTRRDLGYLSSQSQLPINLLHYADDTCLIGNSLASCQHLLDMMSAWLDW